MESAAVVRIYESRLWRRSLVVRFVLGLPFEREYQLILESARLDVASDVLDLACGSGIYSRPFTRVLGGGCVVGLDLSPAMLAHARRLTAEERLANLFFVRGSGSRSPPPTSISSTAVARCICFPKLPVPSPRYRVSCGCTVDSLPQWYVATRARGRCCLPAFYGGSASSRSVLANSRSDSARRDSTTSASTMRALCGSS